MLSIMKEPLLHFLLLGAGLFLLFALMQDDSAVPGSGNGQQIIVSENIIARLTETFNRTHQRLPIEAEKQALIDNYIKKEAAFRKGKQLGLLENDATIKNRVKRKLEFIIEDSVSVFTPDDKTLQAFMQSRAGDYRTQPLFSFQHIYFNPDKHDQIKQDMENLKNKLVTGENTDISQMGDAIFLDPIYQHITGQELSRLFGRQFTAALKMLELNNWQTSIRSGYGFHLVKISSRKESELQKLSEIRQQVKQDWQNQQRRETLNQFYEELLKEYTITSG